MARGVDSAVPTPVGGSRCHQEEEVIMQEQHVLKKLWHFTGDGMDAFFFAEDQDRAMAIRDGYVKDPTTIRFTNRPNDGVIPNLLGASIY